jgi:hypothetical protein
VSNQSCNKRHKRVGHIFQVRYKAILIRKESHLLEVSRYVVLNPVRAKAVKEPDEWEWSSYRGTSGKEKPHPCLTTDWIFGQFGSKRRQSEEKYREFVMAGIGEEKITKPSCFCVTLRTLRHSSFSQNSEILQQYIKIARRVISTTEEIVKTDNDIKEAKEKLGSTKDVQYAALSTLESRRGFLQSTQGPNNGELNKLEQELINLKPQ